MAIQPESSPSLIDRFLHIIESAAASDRFLLRLALFVVIFSGIWVLYSLNIQHSEDTPTYGGDVIEGVLGTPRYVNPVLAITRADQDLVALLYSGLMKIDSKGDLVNEIADSITISDDGLTYNIILRNDITFHDGTPLTARDVVYTIQLLQDPELKSPQRGNWTDIIVEEIGEYELNIVLEEAYAPFIENLTIGIMPAHAWSDLSVEKLPFSQLNTEPIGSGPYRLERALRDTSGLVSQYTLAAFPEHTTAPKISQIQVLFYENEEDLLSALADKEIEATAYIPQAIVNDNIPRGYTLIEEALPRTFAVFFNQNRSAALRDTAAREALTAALDRDELIAKAFFGHGVPIETPTGKAGSQLESSDDTEESVSTSTPTELAIEILEEGGWEQNDLGVWEKEIGDDTVALSITLRTSNAPLFESLSGLIAQQWETVGVQVTTEQFEQSGLIGSVIRPRDFQALLFGHDLSRSYDLYPIWHSSQQSDPGLNVAQYANISVDELLEEARVERDEDVRMSALTEASQIIAEEKPAIFIAQPTLTYIISDDITTSDINEISRPADRFSNIAEWHTESDSLWPMFRRDIE
tara:strand:- start:13644 stop:15389 length:1746 start_codon:yes stop_codon:yes gene_type:complete